MLPATDLTFNCIWVSPVSVVVVQGSVSCSACHCGLWCKSASRPMRHLHSCTSACAPIGGGTGEQKVFPLGPSGTTQADKMVQLCAQIVQHLAPGIETNYISSPTTCPGNISDSCTPSAFIDMHRRINDIFSSCYHLLDALSSALTFSSSARSVSWYSSTEWVVFSHKLKKKVWLLSLFLFNFSSSLFFKPVSVNLSSSLQTE